MNKLKVIDLFCGAGGFTLGFIKHNYNIQLAVDIDSYCKKVYELNLPKINFIKSDLSLLNKKIFCGT